MNELVQRLSVGKHSVEASMRTEKTVAALKEAIDRGYVHIKFLETKGGTELGVNLDKSACDFTQADFVKEIGNVHIVGDLSLNYVKVKCIADIKLETLSGKGYLSLQQNNKWQCYTTLQHRNLVLVFLQGEITLYCNGFVNYIDVDVIKSL